MNLMHWDGPYQKAGLEYFSSLVDIPLSVWYLTFYPDSTTKYIVVAKILIDSLQQTATCFCTYMETYLYFETGPTTQPMDEPDASMKKNGFDNRYKTAITLGIQLSIYYIFCSNILNVIFYCIGYTVASPFVALMEIGIAGKNALIHRDLNLFQDKDKVYPINGDHASDAT